MDNLFTDNNDISVSFPTNSALGNGYNNIANDNFFFTKDHIALYVLNAINVNPHISEYAKDNVEVHVIDDLIVLKGNVRTQLDMFLTLSEALNVAEPEAVVNNVEILDQDENSDDDMEEEDMDEDEMGEEAMPAETGAV